MRRKIVRVKDGEWCALEIELANGRLSICGSAGRVVKRAEAKRAALASWESFFEDDAREIAAMRERCGFKGWTPKSAAKFVIASDGEFHGIDVYRDDGNTVLVLECCGQIREELLRVFPEVEPYLKWHLNDLKAECEHQEARGETWTTHPSAVCPDCGYSLGSAWKKRELPADVIAWAETFGLETEEECA